MCGSSNACFLLCHVFLPKAWEIAYTTVCRRIISSIFTTNRRIKLTKISIIKHTFPFGHSLPNRCGGWDEHLMSQYFRIGKNHTRALKLLQRNFLANRRSVWFRSFCAILLRSKITDRSMTLIFDRYFAVSLFFAINISGYPIRILCNGQTHSTKVWKSVVFFVCSVYSLLSQVPPQFAGVRNHERVNFIIFQKFTFLFTHKTKNSLPIFRFAKQVFNRFNASNLVSAIAERREKKNEYSDRNVNKRSNTRAQTQTHLINPTQPSKTHSTSQGNARKSELKFLKNGSKYWNSSFSIGFWSYKFKRIRNWRWNTLQL